LVGKNLRTIILYGSYARGDYDEESDIDIMVLVTLNGDELKKVEKKVSEIAWDIGIEHNVLVTAFVYNRDLFNERLPISPFYRNVMSEGVQLYAV
jgi:predicted nucleotidyltransferase